MKNSTNLTLGAGFASFLVAGLITFGLTGTANATETETNGAPATATAPILTVSGSAGIFAD